MAGTVRGIVKWRALEEGKIILGVSWGKTIENLRLEVGDFLAAFHDARGSGIGQTVFLKVDESGKPTHVSPKARWAKIEGATGNDAYVLVRGHITESLLEEGKMLLWVYTQEHQMATIKVDIKEFLRAFPDGRGAALGSFVFMKQVGNIFTEISPRARWAQVNKEPEAPDLSTHFI